MGTIQTTPIQQKIQEKTQALLNLSNDKKSTEELLSEILNLKEQDCVEPTELHVKSNDVIETMDMGAICFKICKTGIIFHAKSGYDTWISARCVSLYEQLTQLFGYLKTFDAMSDEEKQADRETYENVQSALDAFCYLFQVPIAASISPLILFKVAQEFVKVFGEETKRMLNNHLHEENAEDVKDNATFEQATTTLDAMAAQMKD